MSADELSGPQKAAILLLALGEEAATEVMENLYEDEVRAITAQMHALHRVTPAQLQRVTGEFYLKRLARSVASARSPALAVGAASLDDAPDDDAAADVVDDTASSGVASASLALTRRTDTAAHWEDASDAPAVPEDEPPAALSAQTLEALQAQAPEHVAVLLQREHPQVVAVILSHLENRQLVREIVASLPQTLQAAVIQRLTRQPQQRIAPALWREIESALAQDLRQLAEQNQQRRDARGPASSSDHPSNPPGNHPSDHAATLTPPVRGLPAYQHAARRAHSTAEADAPRQHAPDAAASPQGLPEPPLSFEDFTRLPPATVNHVLAQCADEDVVLALKLSSQELRAHILGSIPAPFARIVRNALEMLGQVSVVEVEQAQQRLITQLARLKARQ